MNWIWLNQFRSKQIRSDQYASNFMIHKIGCILLSTKKLIGLVISLKKIGGSRTARSPWPSRFSTNLQEGKICCKSSYNVVVSRNIQSSHESRIMRGQETIIVIVIPPTKNLLILFHSLYCWSTTTVTLTVNLYNDHRDGVILKVWRKYKWKKNYHFWMSECTILTLEGHACGASDLDLW